MEQDKNFEQKVQEYDKKTESENKGCLSATILISGGALGLIFAIIPLFGGGQLNGAAIIAGLILLSVGLWKRDKDKTKKAETK